MSQKYTRISVRESSPVIENHVRPTRSPKRWAAARKSAKKTMSGGPMLAVAVSPGNVDLDGDPLEDSRLLLGHVLRRPEGDRPDVDPRHEERDDA